MLLQYHKLKNGHPEDQCRHSIRGGQRSKSMVKQQNYSNIVKGDCCERLYSQNKLILRSYP